MTSNAAQALLSPEARIVLRASAPAGKAGEALPESLEWMSLLTLAERERAALPVWRSLRGSLRGSGGDEVAVLKRMANIWEFKLIHLERLLLQLMRAYQAAGIDVVLLKGAAIAASVHAGFTRRPMLDLDILVEAGREEEAWNVARELGWRWDSAAYPRDAYSDAHHLPPLADAFGSGSGLEIHTRMLVPDHPFLFTEADLRANAVEVEVAGVTCRVPEVHHQLLHTCIHFAWSHRMTSHATRAFGDVGSLTSHPSFQWERLLRLAETTRADSCCYWTLRLASTVARVPVPAHVLRALRPDLPAVVLDALERHYIMNLLPGDTGALSVVLVDRLWRFGVRRGKAPAGIRLPTDPQPMPTGRKLAHHWKQIPDWLRYLSRVLGVRSAAVALTLLSL